VSISRIEYVQARLSYCNSENERLVACGVVSWDP
jgi:hypothetical protein